MSKGQVRAEEPAFNISFVVILTLTLLIPTLVLPGRLENAFFAPKSLLLLGGVCLLAALYLTPLALGRNVPISRSHTPKWMLALVFLNFFSFLYTQNPYHTRVAALINISGLGCLYFVSLHSGGRRAVWLMGAMALSGLFVAVITYCQFAGHFILFKFMKPGVMVTGTIGNSNYLGAYLLFPLFAFAGLVFLVRGKRRLIPLMLFLFVFGALLCSRARASWLGLGIALPVYLALITRVFRFSLRGYVRTHPKRVLVSGAIALGLAALLWSAAPDRFHTMMKVENWTETKSLKARFKYFRASWWLFKENPLFGTGLWSFRNRVYEAQARINEVDPAYFKDYPEPKPRRVHNDYLEILNDGGLIGAAFLLILFLGVMGHGLKVVRDEEGLISERVVAASAFSCLTAMMVASLFFFPSRLTSTLFMAVLMLGLMEAVYLRRYALLGEFSMQRTSLCYLEILLIYCILIGILLFGGYRPFKGELAYLRYMQASAHRDARRAEHHIREAISYDPYNSRYTLHAAKLYMDAIRDLPKANDFFEETVNHFNGDLTLWSVYYGKAAIKLRMGSLLEAREALKKALYYNPNFQPAREKLEEVEKVIQERGSVVIKFR